jgi:cobalt-zinc-cadmium efflux system outer membrane protein
VIRFVLSSGFLFACILGLTGCTIHPPGERSERDLAGNAGKPFESPITNRQTPPLSDHPTADDLVDYALLSNAELEQRYWEWRSAIEQIPQDGTQSTSLNIAAGTTFTNGRTNWRGSTLTLGNDPMTDIKWPGKLDAAARQSLENARAAGQRFIKAKYDLRYRVLNAYWEYALTADLIRLDQRDQQLLRTIATLTAAQNRAGSSNQRDVLKTINEVDLVGNEIANLQSQLPAQQAAINALLNRPADAIVPAASALPPARSIDFSDSQLIDFAANANPELIALADEIRGRDDGLRLARLAYVPDFNLGAGTDLMGVTQSLLGEATIPFFRYEAINAAVAQAQANLRASQAMRRQASSDLAPQVVTDIAFIRDSDRQINLFGRAILPRQQQAVAISQSAYEAGRVSLLELLDDRRSLISIERLVASLRVAREKHLAELESIVGTELSTPPNTLASRLP